MMYKPGDILRVKFTGFHHYGIYVGNGNVIHNSKKNKSVGEINLKEFSEGRPIRVSGIRAQNPLIAVQNARKYLGLPYNLFCENCEHFVRTVCGLTKESAQVQRYLISALGVGALLKSESSVVKAAGGTAAITALLSATEKSPAKNAAIAGCLAAGIAFLIASE